MNTGRPHRWGDEMPPPMDPATRRVLFACALVALALMLALALLPAAPGEPGQPHTTDTTKEQHR